MQNPDNLYVYRLARELVPDVYRFIGTLPSSERYNLAHQMRRSSTSIRNNLAESCRRKRNSAKLPRVYDAEGSATELKDQLGQSLDVSVGDAKQARGLLRRVTHLEFSIRNLIRSMERSSD